MSKKLKIKISKEKYFLSLVVFLIVIMIPSTLIFNYTDKLYYPFPFFPSLGKYHPSKPVFDIDKIATQMIDNSKDITVFIFSSQYYYVDLFFTRLSYLNPRQTEIVYVPITKKNLEIRKEYPPTSEEYDNYYEYLIENNQFHLENITVFDYIIVLEEKSESADSEKFYTYNLQLLDYLSSNPEKFLLFKKFKIPEYNSNLFIYKINLESH